MNTREIEGVLRRARVKDFDGIFSADTLPSKPRLLVVSTDESHKPGRHWVCMRVNDGCGEYFDSFGEPPTANFERYMDEHCLSSWTFNSRQLQSVISRFCGHYCICYCVLRSRGMDMPKIVNRFTTDTALNDVLAHRFVCRVLNN